MTPVVPNVNPLKVYIDVIEDGKSALPAYFAPVDPAGLTLRIGQLLNNDSGAGLLRALAVITNEPVRVLGEAIGSLASSAGRLVAGGVFDPAARGTVQPSQLLSQGRHTPFAFEASAMELPGRVHHTLVAGHLAYSAETA